MATDLADKRQYARAEAAVTLGQRLSPKDEQLSELLVKIEALKSDPKSANISGTWVCNENGNVPKMTLTDSGADDVAWTLSEAGGGGRQNTGVFTRTGAALEGTRPFEMQGVYGQLTLKARIETPDTIVVQSSVFTPSKSKQPPRRDNTKHFWTRQAASETVTLDETEESKPRSPNSRPSTHTPGMRTDNDNPLGPRAPAPRRKH